MKENLSELVSRRIRELNTTKAAIATKTGLSRAYITDIANGTANTQSGEYRPKPETVSKLAKALQISEFEILNALGYSDANNSESRKPRTPAEFFEILDDLGLDVNLDGGLKTVELLDEDDLQDLLDSVVASAVAKAKRKMKSKGE